MSCQCIQQSPGSVGWLQGLALPCACIWALLSPELQLSAVLIFMDHFLGRITAFVTILVVCLLNLALWITALVAYFTNSVSSPSHPS